MSNWQPEAVWHDAFLCPHGNGRDRFSIRIICDLDGQWEPFVECWFLDIDTMICDASENGKCPISILDQKYSTMKAAKEAAEKFIAEHSDKVEAK